jgi:hypothetical protein
MKYILKRLQELSTWRVLAALLTGVGGPIVSEGVTEAAAQIVGAAILIYEAMQKDK